MIKNILVAALATLSFSFAQAQYVEDAYRFSNNTLNGTARILGMGGAQTALGADLSSISGNPAGLGFYRSNDYSVSPNLRFNNLENTVFGKLNANNHTNFNLGNYGFVLTQMNQDYTGGKWGWQGKGYFLGQPWVCKKRQAVVTACLGKRMEEIRRRAWSCGVLARDLRPSNARVS